MAKKNVKSTLKRRVGGYAGSFVKKLRRSLISRNNVATSELLNSIFSRTEDRGDYVGFVVSFKGYGGLLNKNIHPKSMPSIDAIVEWMKRKNIQPRRNKKGRFVSRKQAAYAIAKAIQRDGFSNFNPSSKYYISDVGWLDVVWQQETRRLRNDSRKELFQAVRNMTQESLTFKRPTQFRGESFNERFF